MLVLHPLLRELVRRTREPKASVEDKHICNIGSGMCHARLLA